MQNQAVLSSDRRFQEFRRPADRFRYGLRQEDELRRGLSSNENLIVHHNMTEDAIYKMDLIVRFRGEPMLPAVGIQFTTKCDPDKMDRTFTAVRRTRIVSRMLYLEAECPLRDSAFDAVGDLIWFIAHSPKERGFVSAVLTGDEQGTRWFRELKSFPFETGKEELRQEREEKVA